MTRQPRVGPRIPVELPVEIVWKGPAGNSHHLVGKTGNISGNGLFFMVGKKLRRTTPISITVELPSEVTQVPLVLRCRGRVVRWNRPHEKPGMGAIIDDYELRPVQRRGAGANVRRSRAV